MKRRELSDDIIEITESTPDEVVGLLGKFNIGEYWEKSFDVPKNPQDTTAMNRYIEQLKQNGLDIGKGVSQFGYRMPLPEKGASVRYIHIFRRR